MFPTDLKTWLLYIFLTILLGALGSGFWETIFKPTFSSIGRIFLKICTLGMVSAVNSIHKDIARRSVHKPVLFIIMLLTFAFSGLFGAASHDYYLKSLGGAETAEQRIINIFKNKGLSGIELEKKKLESELAFIFLILVTFGFTLTSYSFVRNSYIISAIIYFDQCLAICLPYLDDGKKLQLLSDYAQINTGKDFTSIIIQLKELAEQNGIKLPTFKVL